MIDFAAGGTLTRSLIDQAILIVQRLINGIRLGRFEGDHPAAKWRLRTTWTADPKDDSSLGFFDEEWSWMGSYATWRSAKMTYEYPENQIFPDLRFPELRTDLNQPPIRPYPSKPYEMSQIFRSVFLPALRKIAPSEPTEAWVNNNTQAPKLVANGTPTNERIQVPDYEKEFFVPVAIGVMLERARKYSQALDWYGKVYNISKPLSDRVKDPVLTAETGPYQAPRIRNDDRWTLSTDPHINARSKIDPNTPRFVYPYRRFVLARIVTCLIGWADVEFARGTDESRATALDLYLEARQILGFDELKDPDPSDNSRVNLPNPVFVALRERASTGLRKLRRGLTYIGTPVVPELTRISSGISLLSRPTPYRFRVLMERAKQLVAIAQNVEAQYLVALEKRDNEAEKVQREKGNEAIANETRSLRLLQQAEAQNGVALSQTQKSRSQILRNRYAQWIAAGQNQFESAQLDAIKTARVWRQAANVVDTAVAAAQAAQTGAGLFETFDSLGTKQGLAVAMAVAAVARGAFQGLAIGQETEATINGILASQERRKEEWQLQRDLADKDVLIADQQIILANDRLAIATQELRIAGIQYEQTIEMLKFLSTKFTSVEFYDWMSGVLAEVYAFLLRTATTVALQAEGQLAFERQQPPGGLIKQDYWNLDLQQRTSTSSSPDRRGITGSAKLLQDITALDQYAFDSERRLLNLSQTFSLSRLAPLEFEEFRQTGILNFATTLRMFDEGFPGHYMRLIKRVQLSVAALIPPNQGIRATLSTSGLSRVVTGDSSFPTLVICQDPQSVALSSPSAATGIFELDMQSELLFPFEGMGVDTNWILELPPAGNPFDFNTLFDVLMTIEYTALNSIDLHDRVIKQLPQEFIGDRAFSVRRDLLDTWYDIANSSGASVNIPISLSRSDFPSQLQKLSIREIAVNIRRKDGQTCDFKVTLSVSVLPNPAPQSNSIQGTVSSRQSGAASWHSALLDNLSAIAEEKITWNFALSDADVQSASVLELLRKDEIEDILLVFTFAGLKPAWR